LTALLDDAADSPDILGICVRARHTEFRNDARIADRPDEVA
jgi:hypothetical protein